MSTSRRFTIFILTISALLIHSLSWATEGKFSGNWTYIGHVAGSSKPDQTFEIKLNEASDGTVTGSYCFITQNANRIDCGTAGDQNIHGYVSEDGRRAEVHFYSFFGAKDGIAELISDDGLLVWKVKKNPKGDFFYGPYSITLTRKQAETHQGEHQVIVDRAFLYPTALKAKVKTYIIKGEYVKLISISNDFKFWKISYSEKNGATIERWIDCHAINFCP
ncbi:hypothetical protein [Paraburkholderia sp. J11-2]|uniref:hypothetical protein n=1 Tax=Paraburkholderia sp. J11-2 TaxID=2805431 RepID=UPI002AB69796|nr:hypothetical protein [Paraburkholderia sp. J11-2]